MSIARENQENDLLGALDQIQHLTKVESLVVIRLKWNHEGLTYLEMHFIAKYLLRNLKTSGYGYYYYYAALLQCKSRRGTIRYDNLWLGGYPIRLNVKM